MGFGTIGLANKNESERENKGESQTSDWPEVPLHLPSPPFMGKVEVEVFIIAPDGACIYKKNH